MPAKQVSSKLGRLLHQESTKPGSRFSQLTRPATPANISSFIALPNNLKSVPNLSHDTIGFIFLPEFTYVLERG